MSKTVTIWDKGAVWPSVITVFAFALIAQIPHIYYLYDIAKLNSWTTLPLLIAFPIFGAIGLSAVSLLMSEYLIKRVRDSRERKLFRYLIRGSLISILIYFVIQFLIVFFVSEISLGLREFLPDNIVDSVTFKEIIGMSVVLLIGVFINPPIEIQFRRRKK
ncbi:MAG: hypothetical protein ACXABK_03460 [Candidatus Heimdallarchaeaceae archaeon]|jgi:hypothetical protein